nr:MAG TPA: hypothetical protein [Bacteriophage sp.]
MLHYRYTFYILHLYQKLLKESYQLYQTHLYQNSMI